MRKQKVKATQTVATPSLAMGEATKPFPLEHHSHAKNTNTNDGSASLVIANAGLAQTPITGRFPYTISQPGDYYIPTNIGYISNSAPGNQGPIITINAYNVNLNLNGHSPPPRRNVRPSGPPVPGWRGCSRGSAPRQPAGRPAWSPRRRETAGHRWNQPTSPRCTP